MTQVKLVGRDGSRYNRKFTVEFDLSDASDSQIESHLRELHDAWSRAEGMGAWLVQLERIIKNEN